MLKQTITDNKTNIINTEKLQKGNDCYNRLTTNPSNDMPKVNDASNNPF